MTASVLCTGRGAVLDLLVDDLSRRVQQLCDPRRDRVPFDAGPGDRGAGGRGGHEYSGAASGFEDAAAIKSQAAQELPAGGGEAGRGVEGVRGSLLGLPQLIRSQQPLKPLAHFPPGVFAPRGEGGRHRSPARPAPEGLQVAG